ncbi:MULTISPECIES: hypothetical protein [unclassified Streptomyces]|uniref:hypothetical protein n=1 Tax=unclassified Streptomyces TaxID=2593676 RepID=UPI0036F63454
MTATPFPEVTSSDDLDAVEPRMYVECSGCVQMVPMLDGMDPVEWAESHAQEKPWHRGYRVHAIKNFSVTAGGYPLEPFPALQSPRTGA